MGLIGITPPPALHRSWRGTDNFFFFLIASVPAGHFELHDAGTKVANTRSPPHAPPTTEDTWAPPRHHTRTHTMSKRRGDERDEAALKGGDRPDAMDVDDDNSHREMGEFADEFEDEFESEEEIFEAGVDGRPDAEREAEEKGTSGLLVHLRQLPATQH